MISEVKSGNGWLGMISYRNYFLGTSESNDGVTGLRN